MLIVLPALASVCEAQLDAAFQAQAMAHVRYLAGLGNRVTGSEGEAKAIRYFKQQLEMLGIQVAVEPFEFSSFALARATVSAGGQHAAVERLA
jgi:hypothetical protein